MAEVEFDNVTIKSEFTSEVGTLASGETLPSSLGKIAGHISNGGNPHNVTASQVGAYTTAETDSLIEKAHIYAQGSLDYDSGGSGVSIGFSGDSGYYIVLVYLEASGYSPGVVLLDYINAGNGSAYFQKRAEAGYTDDFSYSLQSPYTFKLKIAAGTASYTIWRFPC